MTQFLAIVRQEWRFQRRTTRFRLGIVVYVALACVPALVTFFFVTKNLDMLIGANTYLGQLLIAQPFATALLSILVAGNGSHRDAVAKLWIPLASARMSSFGYLFRRWMAQQTILLPATVLPLVAIWILSWSTETASLDKHTWLGHWALLVLPIPLIVGALWLGMSVLAGGELVALLLSVIGLNLFDKLLDQALSPWRLTSSGVLNGLRPEAFFDWLAWSKYSPALRNNPLAYAATQASSDLAIVWHWVVTRHLFAVGFAVLILALASAFLRRTQRDLQPTRVSDQHPLRSYIGLFTRLRQRHAPDACLGPQERWAIALGCMALFLAIGCQWSIQRGFQRQANERYETATEWVKEPMPLDLEVTDWHLRGELESSGGVQSSIESEMTYHGSTPLPHLAFTLNPTLDVVSVEVPGRELRSHRAWDRWALNLEPPLVSGDKILLRVRVEGRPTEPFFGFYRGPTARSFVDGFEAYHASRFISGLTDFTLTETRPSITHRRIDLQPGDLGPVPRFTTWQLTPRSKEAGEFGQEVPEETFLIPVDVDVQIEAPKTWLLGDSCGQLSRLEDGRQLLTSRCRTSLTGYILRGGHFERLDDVDNGLVLAVLPAHVDRGRTLLQALSSVIGLSERAWPGLQGLRGLVVFEWPPIFDADLMNGLQNFWWAPHEEELDGALLSLPESMVISSRPLRAEALVGRVMARDLLTRRPIAPTQEYLFNHLFSGLTVRRMGLDESGAVLQVKPWGTDDLRVPLLIARPEHRDVFDRRLPAVMAELEHRIGSNHLYSAIEAFLARQDGPPGTIEELFEGFEAHSGVSLERFYNDHFVESTLPYLRLEDVRRKDLGGGQWETIGSLRNQGSGESICPLLVSTETTVERLVVTVDSLSSTPFSLQTSSPPLGVTLDPQKTCLRMLYRSKANVEKVDLVGTELEAP